MAPKSKPAPVGDLTRTERSARHRERLAAANGRRVVVDMPEPVTQALDSLLDSGYGSTQKEVVCNALLEIAQQKGKGTGGP